MQPKWVPQNLRPPARAGVPGGAFRVVFFVLFLFFVVGFWPWEVAHLYSREISHRMPSESCLAPRPGARVMSMFVKTYIFGKDALGETHG